MNTKGIKAEQVPIEGVIATRPQTEAERTKVTEKKSTLDMFNNAAAIVRKSAAEGGKAFTPPQVKQALRDMAMYAAQLKGVPPRQVMNAADTDPTYQIDPNALIDAKGWLTSPVGEKIMKNIRYINETTGKSLGALGSKLQQDANTDFVKIGGAK